MKVFREWKYRQSGGTSPCKWVQLLEGKTEEEIRKTGFGYTSDWLVEENKMAKEDLKNGDIVTLRNGDRLMLSVKSFCDLSENNHNPIYTLNQFKDDLTYYINEREDDIIKVERPVKYETVFEREEEVQELTVDEMSERLGYKVKVVGEDR